MKPDETDWIKIREILAELPIGYSKPAGSIYAILKNKNVVISYDQIIRLLKLHRKAELNFYPHGGRYESSWNLKEINPEG